MAAPRDDAKGYAQSVVGESESLLDWDSSTSADVQVHGTGVGKLRSTNIIGKGEGEREPCLCNSFF